MESWLSIVSQFSSNRRAAGRRRALRGLAGVAALALAGAAGAPAIAAQSTGAFPERPIKLVSPFSPGGGTDTIARLLAQQLTTLLGQSVIVENRPGADGAIGTGYVAQAKPDGYTMLLGNFGTFAVLPFVSKVTYDPVKDFIGVSQTTSSAVILVVSNKVKVNSVKELVDLARKNPGKLNYGSSSTSPMIVTELFKQSTGTDIARIPYKGTGPALTAILSGEVDLMFGGAINTIPSVKQGQLKALATAGSHRVSILPDVPTVAEAGIPGFAADSWNGVMVPAGTPMPIVKKLSAAIAKALNSPEVRKAVAADGAEAVSSTPEQFTDLIRSEYQRWGKVAKAANLDVNQ